MIASMAAIRGTSRKTSRSTSSVYAMPGRLVVAIGGNATHPENIRGTTEEQEMVAARAARSLLPLLMLDNRLILIHPLVLCPPIKKGERYLLVERTWWGQRDVLKVGRARSPHESLNLARVG